MLKRSLFLILFIASFAFAQYNPSGFYYESILLPGKSGMVCYITYRAAYSQFVFIKEEGRFTARFSFSAEAQDESGKVVAREIVTKEITSEEYEKTSRNDVYVQGFIALNIPDAALKVQPSVADLNSGKEMMLYPSEIKSRSDRSNNILPPVVFGEKESECKTPDSYLLVNYEGNIPLAKGSFGMIIPVADTSVKAVDVILTGNGKQTGRYKLTESFLQPLTINECGSELLVARSGSNGVTRNFILHNFNAPLNEGKLQILIANASDSSYNKTFMRYVRWYNKPRVLYNPVLAGRLLRYIADDKEAENLKRLRKDEIRDSLFVFWKKYDPTPNTAFNELMEEFYQRADYAIDNFSVLTSANGAETDRGRVYILYGKPDDVKRTYNEGVVTEIWLYGKKQFVFLDRSGIGNFQLIKA